MATVASRINTLPGELLETIFDYIPPFCDKAQLRLVCKLRYDISGGVKRFAYYEDSAEQFCDSLQHYQRFQNNVLYLRALGKSTPEFSGLFVESILALCHNLVELALAMDSGSNSRYIRRLSMLGGAQLPGFHRFDVWDINDAAKRRYVEILRNLVNSLTCLNLTVDGSILMAANTERNVDRFLALFSLKYLRLHYKPFGYTGDFLNLFSNHNKELQTIKITGALDYHCQAQDLEIALGTPVMGDFVKPLELDVEYMDILCFRYITRRLTNVEKLRIFVHKKLKIKNEQTRSRCYGARFEYIL